MFNLTELIKVIAILALILKNFDFFNFMGVDEFKTYAR